MFGSIRKIGDLDLAELSFRSTTEYSRVEIVDSSSISSGARVFVSGFPLPTQAVPKRVFRFLDGMVIANASIDIPKGYSLLYNNKTLPGMSGGAVLNEAGKLIGIHGQGETDYKLSQKAQIAVKTGTNQGIPTNRFAVAGASSNSSESREVSSVNNPSKANNFQQFWVWISSLLPKDESRQISSVSEIKFAKSKPRTASDYLVISNSLKEDVLDGWDTRDDGLFLKMAKEIALNARISNAISESSEGYVCLDI